MSNRLVVPVLGLGLWAATLIVGLLGVGSLTLVDAFLLLAVVAIVPIAVPLHPAAGPRAASVALAAGAPVAPALLLGQGVIAAALSLPWFLAAAVAALVAVQRWWTSRHRLRDLPWPASAVYLAVGGVWLTADRLDAVVAGFGAPLVQLTAVHFHYAGFISAVLVGCAWRRLPDSRLAAGAAALTVAAPPIIATGFARIGMLQILGAAMITAGLWLLAWLTIRHIAPTAGRLPATLLTVSSLAVLVPMLLAVQWAVGANLGTPALSIPAMTRTHGLVNALAFALPATIGWRLLQHAGSHTPDDGRHPPTAIDNEAHRRG